MTAAPLFRTSRPLRAVVLATVLAALGCGRSIDGPVAGSVVKSASNATLSVKATFDNPATSPDDFDAPVAARVIVYGVDPNNAAALVEVANVVQTVDPTSSPDSGSVLLNVSVPTAALSSVRSVLVKAVNATGDTTYKAGPTAVSTPSANSRDSVKVESPATYVGPGSNAARVAITPRSATVGSGDAFLFTAAAFAADKSQLEKVVLKWSTLDPDLVKLDNSRDGLVLSRGIAGTARVVVTVDGATAADTATLVVSAGSRSITLVSGDAQSAIARTTLPKPIVVRVLGIDGKPQAGATVSFNVLSGKTGNTPVRVQTDSLGLAQTRWTLGSDAGMQQMSAELVGARAYVLVNATALRYTLSYVSGADQSAVAGAPLAKPIVVQLKNGSAPVAGGTVRFAVKLGGGSVKDSLVTTDSLGMAQTTWTIGSGTTGQQLVATADGASEVVYVGANPSSSGSENAGAASASIVSGDKQSALLRAALAAPIVVRVLKADGKPAVGATVKFAASAGTLSNTAAVADTGGLVQTRWTMGTSPGNASLRIEIPGGKVESLTASATAWTYVLSLVSGNNQIGSASTMLATPVVLKVTGLDKPIRSETLSVAITGGGSVTPSTLITDSLGLVSLKWTLGASGTQQLLASSAHAIARATVDAKLPDVVIPKMSIVSLSPAVVGPGGTLMVSVRVTNQSGVALGAVPVTLTSDVATDSIVGQTGTTDANGIARFGMLARSAGAHVLTAVMTAPAPATATTTLTVVEPVRSAVRLIKVSGDSQTVKRGLGAEQPFIVQAVDAAGKPVAGAFVDFGGDNGENRRVTNANGVASFTRTTTTDWPKGVFTIQARLNLVPDSAVTFTFTVTP